MTYRQVSILAASLAGVAIFLIYILTMPHGLTWDLGGADGGDLATAVYRLGVAHPPGYPTYTLLGQPFRLLPLASPAYRLNIFSAFSTAAAAVATMLLTFRMQVSQARTPLVIISAAVTAGVLFGLNQLIWSQAVIIEVYALAAAFGAALMLVSVSAAASASDREYRLWVLSLGILGGLGMGTHYTITLCLLFGLANLLAGDRRLLKPAHLTWLVAGFASGLLVFAYLPLRAGASPLSNWGSPDTPGRLQAVIFTEMYAGRFQIGLPAAAMASLVKVLVEQVTIPGIILSAIGISVWWDEHRGTLIAATLTIVGNIWLVASYYTGDTLPYLYPSLILLAVLASSGLAYVLGYIHTKLAGPSDAIPGMIGIVTALAMAAALLNAGLPTISGATIQAEQYGLDAVREASPRGVILSSEDRYTFAIWYTLAVGDYPEIVPIDTRLWEYDWYRANVKKMLGSGVGGEEVSPNLIEFIKTLPGDIPIYTTARTNLPDGWRTEPTTGGSQLLRVIRAP